MLPNGNFTCPTTFFSAAHCYARCEMGMEVKWDRHYCAKMNKEAIEWFPETGKRGLKFTEIKQRSWLEERRDKEVEAAAADLLKLK